VSTSRTTFNEWFLYAPGSGEQYLSSELRARLAGIGRKLDQLRQYLVDILQDLYPYGVPVRDEDGDVELVPAKDWLPSFSFYYVGGGPLAGQYEHDVSRCRRTRREILQFLADITKLVRQFPPGRYGLSPTEKEQKRQLRSLQVDIDRVIEQAWADELRKGGLIGLPAAIRKAGVEGFAEWRLPDPIGDEYSEEVLSPEEVVAKVVEWRADFRIYGSAYKDDPFRVIAWLLHDEVLADRIPAPEQFSDLFNLRRQVVEAWSRLKQIDKTLYSEVIAPRTIRELDFTNLIKAVEEAVAN